MTLSVWLPLLFAAGLLAGGIINVLADDLPHRLRPERPQCYHCQEAHPWLYALAIVRLLFVRGSCTHCGAKVRTRAWVVEMTAVLLFVSIPFLLPNGTLLVWWIDAFYFAVLLLIIVIDLEHHLILNLVTYPVTLIALLLSFTYRDGENSIGLALVGAVAGYLIFLLFYWLGNKVFGAGALGFGDVKMAMMMGAMLGFHRIFFALILTIILGAAGALFLWIRGQGLRSYFAYGPYLAVAAGVMLIWGMQLYAWYVPAV